MATEYPEYYCYALAARSAFFVPIWRHVHGWFGTEVCTKTNFHRLLGLGVQGPFKRYSSSAGGADINSSCKQIPSPFLHLPPQIVSQLAEAAPELSSFQESLPSRCSYRRCSSEPGGGLTSPKTSHNLSIRPSGRLSLTGSIKASFRMPHTLSDEESSDCEDENGPAEEQEQTPNRLGSIDSSSTSNSDNSNTASLDSNTPMATITTVTSVSHQFKQPLSDILEQQQEQQQLEHQDYNQQLNTDSNASKNSSARISSASGMPLANNHRSSTDSGSSSNSWQIDPKTGRRKTGVSVGLMVGGIAEMFMIRKDHERIKLKDRKGFVRIALEHGTDILPVYMFGANQVLDFGPSWLQRVSRKLRASVGMIMGVWGLPIPRRVPIFMVTGKPLAVGPALRKDHPHFQQRVDELHAQFIAEMERIYYTHRGKYGHGFENRPLVIC
eukprot:GHRR01005112.1.p1 GENE.GHRR01005112.1~~GHRR01005112.1.p1  ORF type:complete len:440 (+),score=147.49 GHRR01005112.1:185-1504(+)